MDNPFSQYQNSNSKWNQEMTPVQMGRESLFKLNDFEAKRTPDVYVNRKNSVMTELINSATIEKEKEGRPFVGRSTSQLYIPEESNLLKKQGYFGTEQSHIREEEEDNISYNSAFGVGELTSGKRVEKEAEKGVSRNLEKGFQRNLFPSISSPQNQKMFHSPMQRLKNSKEDASEMMIECHNFFDRSYSKILQSQTKNGESSKKRKGDQEGNSSGKSNLHNFFGSNNKQSAFLNDSFLKQENLSSFSIKGKRFSFANQPQESGLANLCSQIGPNMSNLNLTLSPSNSKAKDSFAQAFPKHINSNNLADIILNAKNGIEKSFLHSPSFSRNFEFMSKEGFHAKWFKTENPSAVESGGFNLFGKSFQELPKSEKKSLEKKELLRNEYTVQEMKEAMESSSNKLLSNCKGSLGSLSNKKLTQFTNSEKNKKALDTEKKSKSGSKESEERKKNNEKRNKSSSIHMNSTKKYTNHGLLFVNSNEKINLEPKSSLIPLNQDNSSIGRSSNSKGNPLPFKRNLASPFPQTLSPFFNSKQMPSTAKNTLSQMTKFQTKNSNKIKIGHFTPVSGNSYANGKLSIKTCAFDNKISKRKKSQFGEFDVDLDRPDDRRKTPDSVVRKLGKRGGSDAKKCQTPGSFLASYKKKKKKVRNM